MSVFVDPDRLLQALERSLRQRVLPALAEPNARFSAECAIEMLIHLAHRRHNATIDAAQSQRRAEELRQLTSSSVDDGAARRITELLSADTRFYRTDDATYREALIAAAGVTASTFDPPDDAALTSVVRHATGDESAAARFVGRAIGGNSKQTIFFEVQSGKHALRQLVMRRDLPTAERDRSSVTSEFALLQALYEKGVPVAKPLYVEADAAVLATPFMVSERAPGKLYGNSLGLKEVPNFDPEGTLGRLLAHLHTIDVNLLDAPGFERASASTINWQTRIDGWISIYRQTIDVPAASLEVGLAWLRANAHLVAGAPVIVHGDVGYHNILFHEGRVSALLDWELVHTGSAAEDLAYVRSYIGKPDALIDAYVAAGGSAPNKEALTYCEVFGDVRNAIYGVVAMRQFNRGDYDDVSALPIILSSYARYLVKLDSQLNEIIAREGFISRSLPRQGFRGVAGEG
ncbi:MAG: phosphotransferase family protein [Steroidobacteraceae bacterium]